MRITSAGQISQPVETATETTGASSVSYTIDFSKSNLQTWVLDSSNSDLTLNTPTNMVAGRTVRLYIDFSASPYISSITLPGWVNFGDDITSPVGLGILIELTSWGTAVGSVTADCKDEGAT